MSKQIKDKSIVILTAHGHPKAVANELNKRGLMVLDATCPFVNNSFSEMVESITKGHEVIYIGKKNHPEADAACSLSSKIHLIEIDQPLDLSAIKDKNPLVISQTTFSKSEVEATFQAIKKEIPGAMIHNGVCHASTKRQEALLSLDNKVELIYIVGGKKSNNTKTLYRLALKHFPNSRILLVENANDVNKKDLIGLSYVAISSGASTPKEVVLEIKNKIESLSD